MKRVRPYTPHVSWQYFYSEFKLTKVLANISGAGGWEDALQKARAFVNNLTLEEKARMVTGKPDLSLILVGSLAWCTTVPLIF
jgi:hypothetical protein